jgi:hypothetical protein
MKNVVILYYHREHKLPYCPRYIAFGQTPKKTLPNCCAGPDHKENRSSFYCCVRLRCYATSFLLTLLAHSVHSSGGTTQQNSVVSSILQQKT